MVSFALELYNEQFLINFVLMAVKWFTLSIPDETYQDQVKPRTRLVVNWHLEHAEPICVSSVAC